MYLLLPGDLPVSHCFCFNLRLGVDDISVNLLLALESCSLARALTLPLLFLVLKEYNCSNLKAHFCRFYTGTCTEKQ